MKTFKKFRNLVNGTGILVYSFAIQLGCVSESFCSQIRLLDNTDVMNIEDSSQNLTNFLKKLAEEKSSFESEISLTLEEQINLQKLIETQTIVPKKNGLLAGLGKSTNLSEGLFLAYGEYVREYFYNLIKIIGELRQEADHFQNIIKQLDAVKGSEIASKTEKPIKNLKSFLNEMNTFCSYLIYFERKNLDKSFQRLMNFFRNNASRTTLSEILETELASDYDKQDTKQHNVLQPQLLQTYFESAKESVLSLYSIFSKERRLDQAIPDTVFKALRECQEKSIKYNETLQKINKAKIQADIDYAAKMKKKAVIASKEEELKAEIHQIKLLMIKFEILVNTIKGLNFSRRNNGYPKTVREDTKKSITNSVAILEKCVELAREFIR